MIAPDRSIYYANDDSDNSVVEKIRLAPVSLASHSDPTGESQDSALRVVSSPQPIGVGPLAFPIVGSVPNNYSSSMPAHRAFVDIHRLGGTQFAEMKPATGMVHVNEGKKNCNKGNAVGGIDFCENAISNALSYLAVAVVMFCSPFLF